MNCDMAMDRVAAYSVAEWGKFAAGSGAADKVELAGNVAADSGAAAAHKAEAGKNEVYMVHSILILPSLQAHSLI